MNGRQSTRLRRITQRRPRAVRLDASDLKGSERRALEWPGYASRSGLPYLPSVTTGWDASPRGLDFGPERPKKYPWWPVVEDATPARFQLALERGLASARASELEDAPCFVASLNEWSEGHYLEPDERFGHGMLESVRAARAAVATSADG